MYGGTDEDIEAKAAEHDKYADGLGKVALQSIKNEDKSEQQRVLFMPTVRAYRSSQRTTLFQR